MARVHVSVEIDATPDEVWAYVEPVENHVDWMSDAVAIRFISERHRGIGTLFECDTKIGPLKLTDIMEITDWVPGRTMGVQHKGVVTGAGVFTITSIDLDRRTRFAWTEELRFPWWLAGPIGASIGGKTVLTLMWNRNLKALKEQIEAKVVAAGSGDAA
ncbi:MAG: SRPBCC family protein [Ilumatobacteraceae bacterium]